MCLDAAPQRPFGGDTDWIRCDLQCADVEAVEMRLPCGMIGKPCQLVHGQLMDDGPSQGTPAHIVQRRFVDDIVRVPGAQQIEEVNPARTASAQAKSQTQPGVLSLRWQGSGVARLLIARSDAAPSCAPPAVHPPASRTARPSRLRRRGWTTRRKSAIRSGGSRYARRRWNPVSAYAQGNRLKMPPCRRSSALRWP